MPTIGRLPVITFGLYLPHLWAKNAGIVMKRGLSKHAKRTNSQRAFGSKAHLSGLAYSPKGVYEFHHHRQLLNQPDGVEKVAQILKLSKSTAEVQQRVIQILKNYYNAF